MHARSSITMVGSYGTLADAQAAWRALVRTVYAVPQHRNAALQGLAAMLSRVDSDHTLVRDDGAVTIDRCCHPYGRLIQVSHVPVGIGGCQQYVKQISAHGMAALLEF
jgi:hypothetical protein